MADNKVVGRQRTHEHDGHVACVEELDGERALLTTELGRLDRDFDTEALQVNDNQEHSQRRDEIRHVGQALAVESLFKRTGLVVPREQKVEQRNDGTLKLGTTTGVDRRG